MQLEDQFGTLTVNVLGPVKLCVAANKNEEGIHDPNAHLLCYKVEPASGSARFHGPEPILTNNQFGPDAITLSHTDELCVPSLLNPRGSTSGALLDG